MAIFKSMYNPNGNFIDDFMASIDDVNFDLDHFYLPFDTIELDWELAEPDGVLLKNFSTQILIDYLNLAYLLFFLGIVGMLFNYKNLLITMLNIELMYFGLVCSCVLISVITLDVKGQFYAMTILILAACESAVGLGILIVLFNYGRTLDFTIYQELRG